MLNFFLKCFLHLYLVQNLSNAFKHTSMRSSPLKLSMSQPPQFMTHFEELKVSTLRGVSLVDITQGELSLAQKHEFYYTLTTNNYQEINGIVKKSGCQEGVVTVLSKHSTVSIMINEIEPRLNDDTRQFLLKLVPPAYPYLHNDVDFRLLFVYFALI